MEYLKSSYLFCAESLKAVFPSLSLEVAIVSLLLGYLLAFLAYMFIRDYGVPPGPTGVPILGYWPFIDSATSHLQQVALKKKYGDIFSFRVTGKLYINLASLKMLREAHISKADDFNGRTSDFNIVARILEKGVVFSNGDRWLTVRRYFLTEFKERGMTLFKENTAEAIDDTVSELVEELRNSTRGPINILKILTRKGNRLVRQTLFGTGSPVTEEEIENIYEDYRQVSSLFVSSNIVLIGNLAKHFIIPFLPFYKEAQKIHKRARERFHKMIDDHRRTFDGDNVRDIIDSYIREKNVRKSKGDPSAEYFSDEALVSNLLQFVGDGVVTVATFVTLMLIALLDHPEEQDKIYKELVDVCGEDRNPTLADKSKLTYTNAFLLEAQRTVNFVPLFPSLECNRETTIGGYRIPKGAVTISNFYATHNDPQVYEHPERFNPSRFLATEGKPREESPVTFGVGKRVCLGEGFALLQVFIFLTAIVKNFKISYSAPKSHFEVIRDRTLEIHVKPRK